jgi:ankyrin repeat protein
MVKNRIKQKNLEIINARRSRRNNVVKQRKYITLDKIKETTLRLFQLIREGSNNDCIEYLDNSIKEGNDVSKYIQAKSLIDPSIINNMDSVITSYKSERLFKDLQDVLISQQKKKEILKCSNHTLLQYACYYKKEKFAEYLIDTFGVKCMPNYINDNNETALMIACKLNLTDLVLKMLKNKCNIEHKMHGKDAMYYAKINNNKIIINALNS